MTGNNRWKTLLAYTMGIVILAVSLIMAWFLPGWYSQWKDERLMGQVTLSSRENIEFLDSDSLDIAGRLEKLETAELLEWEYGYGYQYYDYGYGDPVSYSDKEIVKRCEELIDRWCDAGLLPEDCRNWIDKTMVLHLMNPVLMVNQSAMPVYLIAFIAFPDEGYYSYEDEVEYAVPDEGGYGDPYSEPELMTVLMDAEKDVIYYVSVAGNSIRDVMAKELGYESHIQFCDAMLSGEERIRQEIDTSSYDFAAVCGAEASEITSEPGQLELQVSLHFDNFVGYAGRSLILNEAGYGMAIEFGTNRWEDLMTPLLENLGTIEYRMTTDFWYDMVMGNVDQDTAELILSEGKIEDSSVSDNNMEVEEKGVEEQIVQ